MSKPSQAGRFSYSTLLFLLAAHAPVAFAQTAAPEQALAWTVEDSRLNWLPCPPFMPKDCAIAVLHGDPAQGNVDVFFKVAGQSLIPLHWHTSAERMVLIAGEMQATYEGQETTVLKAGTYAYGPARRPHRAVCVSTTPCVLFIAFESPLDAIPIEEQTSEEATTE